MKLSYTFKHIDTSESLINYTKDRIDEIGRFLLKEGFANVYFSKHKNEFCVEVSINTHQKYFKASAQGLDVYGAVDAVTEKLQKQFLKVKSQVKNHKKPELSKEGKLDLLLKFRKAA